MTKLGLRCQQPRCRGRLALETDRDPSTSNTSGLALVCLLCGRMPGFTREATPAIRAMADQDAARGRRNHHRASFKAPA